MNTTQVKKVILGITGGIAGYKSAELVRLLKKMNIDVQVMMTKSATEFVTPATFQALSGKSVYVDLWDNRVENSMAHIDCSRQADLILIAPASANVIAKLANGICDDLLTTTCLARTCPLVIAPAMNKQMWENPATQRNIAQLRRDGITILGPAEGEQACGEVGLGRMIEPNYIAEFTENLLCEKYLQDRHILITGGPTFEPIDPVRGITNLSSGQMALAIAKACVEAGAIVTLIMGPTHLEYPLEINTICVKTAQQMFDAVHLHIGLISPDIFISVAAVADYRVKTPFEHKIKKQDQATDQLTLELIKNPDILASVANLENPPFCVGFSAESHNLHEYAENKRKTKKIPLIAGNLVQTAIGEATNEIILFDDNGTHVLGRSSKIDQARKLMRHVNSLVTKTNHS